MVMWVGLHKTDPPLPQKEGILPLRLPLDLSCSMQTSLGLQAASPGASSLQTPVFLCVMCGMY